MDSICFQEDCHVSNREQQHDCIIVRWEYTGALTRPTHKHPLPGGDIGGASEHARKTRRQDELQLREAEEAKRKQESQLRARALAEAEQRQRAAQEAAEKANRLREAEDKDIAMLI